MDNPINPQEIQQFLQGVKFPITKDELINILKEKGANDMIINALQKIPSDKFNSLNEVTEGIGTIKSLF